MDGQKILDFGNAAEIIKDAIVRSRYQAAKLINKELLGLYYAVGRYVSENSRVGAWGKGAIRQLSELLQRELPGLRGFGEVSLKKMRLFYEAWQTVFADFSNRQLLTDDLGGCGKNENRQIPNDDLKIAVNAGDSLDLGLLTQQTIGFAIAGFSSDAFFCVGFSHHSEILAKEKSLDGRFFYIARCAAEFWTVDTLKSYLRGNLYAKAGTMPNNFLRTLPESLQASRAIRAFREEYFLDFINIEDEIDPDERVFERSIVSNIKQFILSFGNKFCFIGNQYRVVVDEKEYFIDLLFFNRELHCLVAVELKRGEFKPSQLGQLFFYLSALDEYVRQPDEAPSIGIVLCKEANRNTVEFAVRDYTKPMGVATYRTRSEMPEEWQKALPDFGDMIKLLDSSVDTRENDSAAPAP
ncbi:MAG: PDDEXK nuclease domain-containing protein [Oscillospiraceae bacterium]|jgi:predicted nuclease of restriction endonuclease-like (RecB) superfamily|nr:PDDEXK nuclease domain-containing protein [Oscillospiraceae bacterium]